MVKAGVYIKITKPSSHPSIDRDTDPSISTYVPLSLPQTPVLRKDKDHHNSRSPWPLRIRPFAHLTLSVSHFFLHCIDPRRISERLRLNDKGISYARNKPRMPSNINDFQQMILPYLLPTVQKIAVRSPQFCSYPHNHLQSSQT